MRTADIEDFVYDPDAAARNRADLRAFAILGVPLVAGLAVAVWLALRWRRRMLPAGAAAEPPSAAAPSPSPAAPPGLPVAAAARSEAAPPRLEPQGADLNALLARLERTIRQRLPRRIAFRLSLLPELWRCRAEAPAIRTLVLDLVAAAAADVGGNGELIVGTRNYAIDSRAVADTPGAQLGDYVRVTVRDNGKGLDEDALDRIFDPLRTPRPSAVAAADAMSQFGGFARVESAEGIGTAVHLYLPRVADPAEDAVKSGRKPEEAAA